jgi:hypothetical protein
VSGRDLPAAVGVTVVLAGLAGLAGFAVPGVNASFVFVVLVGVLAGIQGIRYALSRLEVDPVATDTGDPERRNAVPAPGDKLIRGGDLLDRRESRSGRHRDRRNVRHVRGWPRRRPRTLRHRVRRVVIETLTLREHCSVGRAERLVATGAWTDDPVAARFLGADVSLPISTRLRLRFSRQNSYQRRAARTLDALDALRDGGGSLPTGVMTTGSDRGEDRAARGDGSGGAPVHRRTRR